MPPAAQAPSFDRAAEQPTDRTVVLNLGGFVTAFALVTLAIVFDWVAAKGVIVIAFLSVALAYLVLPAVRLMRKVAPLHFGGWRPSRVFAVTIVYAFVAAIVLPIGWVWGAKISSQVPDVAREVPRHVARFARQVRASERWHEQFAFEQGTRTFLRMTTRRLSQQVQGEVADVGAEVIRARLVVPWLAGVPVLAFLLVAHWPAFHQSAARVFPTPHLKWRTNEFLHEVNMVLAAYTRAQASSALIIGVICGFGFVLMKLPNAAMFGIVAGLLEMIPIAGPLAVAISATAVAPSSKVILVLAFLGGVRLLQDYLIYPRLIRRAIHLHPLAVVVAIWAGAMLGGIVGVCLAVPVVGVVQVAYRHYREYRAIERLVREHDSQLPPVSAS
ncbi:MAG: AI-2E family transporter [Vicinamibacterales bacterium]